MMQTANRRLVLLVSALTVAALAVAGGFTLAFAQEEEERSRLVRFVERQISTPNRQIRLNGIEGALSSDVRLGSITIADRDGVWLTIEDVRLVWSRRALLVGRLDIESLEAERIEVARTPVPAEGAADTEPLEDADAPFALPDLPVAMELQRLSVPVVDIAAGVAGEEAIRLSVDGRVVLADGALDTDVSIERLDRPGTLSLAAAFSNETRDLSLDITLSEPENGVIATLLEIEGRPPITFAIAGTGPLDDYSADIRLTAADETLLSGTTTLSRTDQGLAFRSNVSGNVRPLVPETYAELVEGGSELAVNGLVRDAGGIAVNTATLTSGAFDLDFSGDFSADGVPTALDLDVRLGRDDGERIDLPGGEGEASIASGRVILTLGGPIGQRWDASFLLDGLEAPMFAAERATLAGSGEAVNMTDPDARRVTFDVTGGVTGLSADDPAVTAAFGTGIELQARGAWNAGEPVMVDLAEVTGAGTEVRFSGSAGLSGVIGDFRLAIADLAAFAGIAGRDLAGAIEITADGSVEPAAATFDLTVDGTTRDLAVGIEAVDGLVAGTTRISGSAARLPAGFLFDDFLIENDQARINVNGQTTAAEASLTAEASLADLAAVSDQVAGAVDLVARISGDNRAPEIAARLTSDRIVLTGTALTGFRATLDGQLEGEAFTGRFDADGTLGATPLTASGEIATGADDIPFAIRDLAARIGDASLTGTLSGTPEGPITGEISADVPALSTLAPLLLLEDASGSLSADVRLSAEGERQDAGVTARARAIDVAGVTVGFADIDLSLADVTGVPVGEGSASARDVVVAGFAVPSADLSAARSGDGTRFDVTAALERARLAAGGTLSPVEGGFDLDLSDLSLDGGDLSATLAGPASITLVDGAVDIEDLRLSVGGGSIAAHGRVAEEIDLAAEIDALPLAVANLVYPPLDAGGTLSGTLDASGTPDAPRATFALTGNGLTLAQLRDAGLEPVDVTASGNLVDRTVTLEDARAVIAGGTVSASGTVGERIDLSATVDALPLAIANAFAPDLGLSGSLDATVEASGSLEAPQATFTVSVPDVAAAPLAQAGIPSLSVEAAGRFADETVRLDRLTAAGSGLQVTGSGTIPLSGPGLSVDVRATAPLSIAGPFIAERGATISGEAAADVSVRGSLGAPDLSGTVTANGIRFLDPGTQLLLTDGVVEARLAGDQVEIARVFFDLGGGEISATGTVGIDPAAGLPADIAIALRGARYVSDIAVATASGDISITGPLLRDALVSGNVLLERVEVTVPDGFPGGPTLLEVANIGTPPDVVATLRRAEVGPYAPTPDTGGGGGGGLRIDLTVDAPNQIFVRGRGIDAELGGSITITGTTNDVIPVGSFDLIRGRIDILTERVNFTRGSVTLIGDFDPTLDFLAETGTREINVTIAVTGPASDPSIELSSTPELPEDEILAQLLFGQSVENLSPAQLALLASSASALAGGPSPLEQIRRFTGLADFDIVADEEGGVGVAAGQYVTDNVYLGVEARNDESNVTVNLDVTRDLTIRGSTGTRESTLGFFFQREY